MVAIEFGIWRSGRKGGTSGSIIVGYGRLREQCGGTRSTGGNRLPLGDQESVGCDAQRGVMMKAAPAASLIVSEPDLLLELLIVALDAPAQFGEIDQLAEADLLRQGREPVFGRYLFALRPLDQQPLLRSVFGQAVTMSNPNAHPRKARAQPVGRAFPPLDLAPGLLRQSEREFFRRRQIGFAAASLGRWLAAPLRFGARWPHQGIRLNASDISQSQFRYARAKPCIIAVGRVHQRNPTRKAGLTRPAHLIERDRRLGLEVDLVRNTRLAPPLAILGPLFREIKPIVHR